MNFPCGRALAFFFLVFTPAFASDLRFNVPPRDYFAGKDVLNLVAGDFNQDGIEDVAVANASSVNVLLGLGGGLFRKPVEYQTGGSQGFAIVTADFNCDGHLDLAVAQGNKLVILLGVGDGIFKLAGTQPALTQANSVVSGDFNRDGKLDLATSDADGGKVNILLGNGNGTFRESSPVPAGEQALRLVEADVNGDGRIDLVVSDSNGVSVLIGNGNGSFQPAVYYSLGGQPVGSVAVGDLNGDNRPDILISADTLIFLPGIGHGKFGAPVVASSIPTGAPEMVLRDFNGDGILDAAGADSNDLHGVRIFLGKGDGTFTTGALIGTGSAPYGIIATHINRDRDLDLVTTDILADSISVLPGHGDGEFGQTIISLGDGANGAIGITQGDVNGDEIPDLVTADGSNNISVMLGKGKGKFAAGTLFATGGQPKSVAIADFNRDGNKDVVTANYSDGSVSVLFGNGDGTFRAHQDIAVGIQTQSVVVGDMNSDGIPDIVVASTGSFNVTTLLSNGDGTFQKPINYVFNNEYAGITKIALGDVNGDGKLDVVGEYFYGSGLVLLAGKGDGSLSETDCACGPGYPSGLGVGDFNNDGVLDIAYGLYSDNLLGVSLNAGDSSLQQPIGSPAPASPTLLAIGDFDGDGKLDAVSMGLSTGILTFALGDGLGNLLTGPTYPANINTSPLDQASAAITGDFNGDGKLDLALAQANGVIVFLNETP